MCGILGYVSTTNSRPKLDSLKEAFLACESRGRDATGFFTPETGIVKLNETAKKFIETHEGQLKKAIESNILIGHCRAVTRGSEKNNENNHPHESENFILVHNGTINKTEQLKDYKYRSECDTETILSYVEKYGVKKGIEEMYEQDSMAIALYDKKTRHIFLFRNSNPTNILLDKKEGIIIFGSTSEIIKHFYRYAPSLGWKSWDNMVSFETEEDRLYEIDTEKGLIEATNVIQKKWTYNYSVHNKNNRNGFNNYQGQNEYREYCNKCYHLHKKDESCVSLNSRNDENEKVMIVYRGGTPTYFTARHSKA